MKNGKRSILKGIGGKVLVIFVLTIIAAVGILAFIAIRQSGAALRTQAFNQLKAVRALKEKEISNFFTKVEGDLVALSESKDVELVLKKLIKYHHEMELTAEDDFDMSSSKPGVTETYDDIYAEANSILGKYPELYGYKDLLLICAPHGHVMYSYAKGKDLGSNLGVGRYKDTNLAELWETARNSSSFVIVDMKPYAPADGEPSMFMGMPVKDDGKIIGVVAIAISLEKIDSIMQTRDGMGKTGETYLVGQDYRMRSDSYLDPDGHSVTASMKGTVEANGVDTEATKNAFSGKMDTKVITDYNGSPVLSSWNVIDLGRFKWAIITKIDLDEVNEPVNALLMSIIISTVIIIIIAVVVALIFSKSLVNPIMLLTEGAILLSTGDIALKGIDEQKRSDVVKRKDELGEIGKAFNSLVEYMKVKALAAENIADGNLDVDIEAVSSEDRLGNAFKQMVESLNEVFGKIRTAVDQLKAGSGQVSQASQALSQGATEQASSVEEIASSLTEINSQSRQNADNADKASSLSRDSVTKAREGDAEVEILTKAMQDISSSSEETKKIVKVIDDIAFQINLLSLNANVEAARAGKYGKGFAVVADEVRNLAVRSAEASKESTVMVEESIKNIEKGKDAAEKFANSLKEIVDGITNVSTVLDEIALASKEQAQGVEQVNEGIEQINQVTQSNTASSEQTAAAAEELAAQAEELNALVNKFQLKEFPAMDNVSSFPASVSQEILQRLVEQELNKRQQVGVKNTVPNVEAAKPVNPKDVIKLDDDDFGEF